MEIKVFEKGSIIFEEGKYESFMYSIQSGKVAIYSNYGKNNETLLTEIEKDGIFGEMGLVEARPRSASAVAVEDTELAVITNDTFFDFFDKEPEKLVTIVKKMSNRLRVLSDSYVDACKTIAEYVKADEDNKPKKPGLLAKIKKLLIIDDEYRDEYAKAMMHNEISFMNDIFDTYM